MSEENTRISKDEYFMKIAEVVSQRSTCVKRKVGAVLVKDSHIISTGYNGVPPGFKHCTPESCVRKNLKSGEKPELCRGIHAEVNCVSENSLMILPNGEITRAKDATDEIFSFDQKQFKLIKSEAVVTKSVKDEIIVLKTIGNFELIVSKDHKMFVMDKIKGIKIKTAENLTLEDYIPIITKININSCRQKLPRIGYDSYRISDEGLIDFKHYIKKKQISQNRLASESGVSRIVIKRILEGNGVRKENIYNVFKALNCNLNNYLIGVERKTVNIPKMTFPDLCQIIGYFIGDGTIGKNFIRFFDENQEILIVYNKLIKKIFGIEGSIQKDPYEKQYYLTISSKRFSAFFEELKIGTFNKTIPKLFHKITMKSLASLIRGLFDAEGLVRIKPKEVALTSGYKKILEIVRLLLLRFGIVSGLHRSKRKTKISPGAGEFSYALVISGEDLLIFKREIGFSHPKKKCLLENIKTVGINRKKLLPKSYFRTRTPSTTNFPVLRDSKWKLITRKKAKEIYLKLKDTEIEKENLQELKKIIDSNLSFIKITKIKRITKNEKMIDFYVPNGNSFLANGILVHNCIIQAAIHGTSIKGETTLYSTTFPCMSCLKLIINAGIKKLIYKEGYNMENKVKEELLKESNLLIEKFGKETF